MNKLLSFLIMVVMSLPIMGQSAQGRYASRMTQDGTIFFVLPKKIGDTKDIKKFEYDMTFLSWTDSVTINFTFRSKAVSRPEDLKIMSCGQQHVCNDYSLLYTDIVKGGYEIRVTSKFPVSVIESTLQCVTPPVFEFNQDGEIRTASYSKGAWKSDRKKLIDIFNLFKLSKE